jgi:predicted N-formylglutamate amidohydrolase
MEPRIIRRSETSRFVFLCDHASNHVPAELNSLNLTETELRRHIAWDIGAAGVAETLSEFFSAPAVFSGNSRLVVDCNRHPDAADLIPEISDGTVIPGNRNLSSGQRAERIERYFAPYHDAIESILLEREARGVESTIVSVHSMTPSMSGIDRPWQISFSSYRDRQWVEPLIAALRRPGDITVGDNQPYDLDPAMDHSVPFHALRRNLPHIQVEFRQDEIAKPANQREWALRFARVLSEAKSA